MKFKDIFLDNWCDGQGMPWLTVDPWWAVSASIFQTRIDIKDALSEYVRHVSAPDHAFGVEALHRQRDARVTVHYDIRDRSVNVEMSVSPHGDGDGMALSSPSVERMLNVLHSLSSEALRHGSGTDTGWDWAEIALFAKVLVESIDHDEDFIGVAA